MGLYTLPGPYEGMMCVITVNADNFVSFFKNIFRTILHVFGINLWPSTEQPPSEVTQIPAPAESFKSGTLPIRYDSVPSGERLNNDCTVCLNKFEPESEIYRLSCGHVFHHECLKQWVDYWNIKCPLCRTPLMPEEESKCFGVTNED